MTISDISSDPQTKGAPEHSVALTGTDDMANGGEVTAADGLTSDEMALYDRQIRLWGAQAQERIRSANILLISLRALGTEIAKSLTLAGVRSLTIIDDEVVTEDDVYGAQFFLRGDDIGKTRAEAAIPKISDLNPRVSIRTDGGLQALLLKDQTYYEPFSCVIACDHDSTTLGMINTAARFASKPFYAAGIHGLFGYIFADLNVHDFVIERDRSNIPTKTGVESGTRRIIGVDHRKESNGKTTEVVVKQEIYCPIMLANTATLSPDITSSKRKLKAVPALLPCLRALFQYQAEFGRAPNHTGQEIAMFATLAKSKVSELSLPPETLSADFLRSFIQNIGAELNPTAAFVGGRLSEDVLNVLSKREQPIQNFALFDGENLLGKIYCLYSPPPELLTSTLDPTAMDVNAATGFGAQGTSVSAAPTSVPSGMQMSNGNGDMSTTARPLEPASSLSQIGENEATTSI